VESGFHPDGVSIKGSALETQNGWHASSASAQHSEFFFWGGYSYLEKWWSDLEVFLLLFLITSSCLRKVSLIIWVPITAFAADLLYGKGGPRPE
jgi:hypothetical protein